MLKKFLLGILLFFTEVACSKTQKCSKRPNIVFIYADDMKKKCLKLCIEKNGITVIVLHGWNDISFHGSLQIPTPNIDALALNGLTLRNYYGEWHCTLSRAALLTGRYPMRYGNYGILGGEASGLPLNEIILPAYLKSFAYETHMIGKWHLGYKKKECTPTYRGFDSYLGYWNGFSDYYDHTYYEQQIVIPNRKPLLLYLAHLAVHSGNPYQPVQAPSEDIAQMMSTEEYMPV
ncbi:arylsulfatase J [Caerostris darwini]|uniref:Arylsulfatase J n=1 Tax=Caerostris darwini TaxID=1538125 RepID=A0AAV4TED1_9ARAC|nr:arylsulfatase J [Caerostris darwini]